MDIKKLVNSKKQNVTFSIREEVLKKFNTVATDLNLNKSMFIEEAMIELLLVLNSKSKEEMRGYIKWKNII